MLSYNPNIPVLLVLSGNSSSENSLLALIDSLRPLRLYVYLDGCEKSRAIKVRLASLTSLRLKCNRTGKGYHAALLAANKWFFKNEDSGIVLNGYIDWKVLPSKDFFGFCSELLERYGTDQRIGHISCGKGEAVVSAEGASYTFVRIPDLTFYATWRRVWEGFDEQLKTFRSFKKKRLIERIPAYRDFSAIWNLSVTGASLNWESQYEYVQLINNRLSILPVISLVHPTDQLSDTPAMKSITHPCFMTDDTQQMTGSREMQLGVPVQRSFDREGYAFIKNQLIRLAETPRTRDKIPKIIHHVCDYPDGIPENLLSLAATWAEKHPGWEQRFWDKEQMDRFVHEVCPEFEPVYLAYPHNVQRWDAVRYLILYHIGGMYVDLDYECFHPFDAILEGRKCCIAVEPALNARYNDVPRIVSNALMASVPGCAFMRKIIEELKTQNMADFSHLQTYKIILGTTGPFMMTRVYNSLKNKRGVTLLPAEIFMPFTPKEISLAMQGRYTEYMNHKLENAFAVHYFLNSW